MVRIHPRLKNLFEGASKPADLSAHDFPGHRGVHEFSQSALVLRCKQLIVPFAIQIAKVQVVRFR
jgi:hypothetical protein